MMQFLIDPHAGFCPGVQRAIRLAEKALQGGTILAYGPLVHNPAEVERLAGQGLKTIEQGDAGKPPSEEWRGNRVLIRSHGLAAQTRSRLEELASEVVDATCPKVARVQKMVAQLSGEGTVVLIVGKREHPEVIGLVGHARGPVFVLEKPEDVKALAAGGKMALIAQTTVKRELFFAVQDALKERGFNPVVLDTTCSFVNNRYDLLRTFAGQVDVVLVVGGKSSSNTGVLYDVCRKTNRRTYRIEEAGECRAEWFELAETVGITGGLSTPIWQLENVAQELQERFSKPG
ncbi:MAG TPA: 4-hydroxy-3-methylbut-2-enyl diphosphate reductase [bacterium]|jgi:4-hydroxy-3-methylbut-2-enyl diphosphate reductase|nr:4-hydroxy-3-methylbut-2-enyl diphosphate reductase [bacterium]HOX86824.1 4-hydroxy-3-methylbut-2-enyl diphosphate reductase [bacterium]HPG46979.1 4-hydroxy-3-methylbut-2-enyl diphosphate reductase [bacterium]HPM99253.1 4-hydroxy-3-methylbut-2-enyl diphosphate reductase [bacterium]